MVHCCVHYIVDSHIDIHNNEIYYNIFVVDELFSKFEFNIEVFIRVFTLFSIQKIAILMDSLLKEHWWSVVEKHPLIP